MTAAAPPLSGKEYWANCAWDALGIAALPGVDTECHAMCAHWRDPVGPSGRKTIWTTGAPYTTTGAARCCR